MKFKVSMEVPGDLWEAGEGRKEFDECLDNFLAPFQGRFFDCMIWSTDRKESYMIWFESSIPNLATLLHEQLIAQKIWSYAIRVVK